jgi:uncharacterized membrane protein
MPWLFQMPFPAEERAFFSGDFFFCRFLLSDKGGNMATLLDIRINEISEK